MRTLAVQIAFGTALSVMLAAGVAFARSPRPVFEDRRVVSASGSTYAVVRAEQAKLRLTLHARREGAPALQDAVRRDGMPAAQRADIAADPEDALLGSVLLGGTLTHVRVSDAPVGALLLDTDGGLQDAAALAFVEADGRVAWTRSLADLLTPQERAGAPGMGRDWLRGVWLDGDAYLAMEGSSLLRVALADGRLERVGPEVLRTRLAAGPPEARELRLELVEAWRIDGVRAQAEALASDAGQPLGVRVRAAHVARTQGGTEPYRALFASAISAKAEAPVRHAALKRIVPTLGDEAFEVIAASVSDPYPGDGSLHLATQALITLKGPLVPRLDALRRTPVDHAPHAVRALALTALAAIGTPEARELLWDTLQKGDKVAALVAFNLLCAAKPDDLRSRLLAAIKAGSPIQDIIGHHLGVHPH